MKLLLYANLSWRMVTVLKPHFDDCLHIDQAGIYIPAKDREIWEFAKLNNLIIVTNDEDFIDLVNVKGFPPKVIVLKTGNQSRLFISNILILRKAEIQSFYNSAESGLLQIVSA